MSIGLATARIDMGVPSAFSGMADADLYLDFVVHEAIDAAPSEPKSLVADHLFRFFIRDDLSGAILFAGRMVTP